MGIEKIFFLLPSKGKFLNNFAQNDVLKAQANQVWRQLDGLTPILLLVTAGIGISFAICYYTWYNKKPGRHYKVKYWGLWAIIAFVLSFVATLVIEYIGIKTNINSGLTSLYWLCALNNAIYCFVLYFITSFVWCNTLPTNAYKFLKL